jgi:hypothetical protein
MYALGRGNHRPRILGLNPKVRRHLLNHALLLIGIKVIPVMADKVSPHANALLSLPVLDLSLALRILIEPLARSYRQPA